MSIKYYLILDVEATCCVLGNIPSQEMEIIEFGAVVLDGTSYKLISEFQSLVKPVLHRRLTQFCINLTGIKQEEVDVAKKFPEVIAILKKWLSSFSDFDFYSWGDYDRKQIERDCRFHNIPNPIIASHYNLKKRFSEYCGSTKSYGLKSALKKVGLELKGRHHRGLDDAKNIAHLFAHMSQKIDSSTTL